MTTSNEKFKKNQKLRNNEYYDIQNVFDNLYERSNKNEHFKNLIKIIASRENILLAYRNIKKNSGSHTKGTNKKTIDDIAGKTENEIIEYVKKRFEKFYPHKVKRVYIPKANGDKRPLGIPTIEDRLIQQCILQVLDPICKAKFYTHSYGFRSNRSAKHAIARAMTLININKLHYVVDVDIKGFFDNVNHGKLLKQLWTLGIRDKKLLKIISLMLKSPIDDKGKILHPLKGTPQGGIISPLLANIVLNELDWWISSQWETFDTKHNYNRTRTFKNGTVVEDKSHKYRALKKTNLKEMYMVRYADDFKVFCRNPKDAQKVFMAIKSWLKQRLNLETSPEKSKVTNLKKDSTEFLGFELKVEKKKKRYVCQSHISQKAKIKLKEKINKNIKVVQKHPTTKSVGLYNSSILGTHNYYRIATRVSNDFHEIAFKVSKSLYNRLKTIKNKDGNKSKAYMKYYGKYKYKATYVNNIALFPIAGIKTKNAMQFQQDVCNYTSKGRTKIHDTLNSIDFEVMRYLLENPIKGETIEYNDNRLSLYVGQQGKCAVTGQELKIGHMQSHHKIPRKLSGTDAYENLTFILANVHKLIHATKTETIQLYMDKLELNPKALEKVNKLRLKVGNCEL